MEDSTKALIPGLVSAVLTSLVGTGLLTTFIFDASQSKSEIFMTIDIKHNRGILEIKNLGHTTLTNFTLFITSPQKIENIVNNFSTTEIFLPIQNITLRNGESSSINNTYVEIRIPKIVKDDGSVILIDLFINNIENLDINKIRINGVYDQGSTKGSIHTENYYLKNILSLLELIGIAFLIFAIIFFFMIRIVNRNILKKMYEMHLLGLRDSLKKHDIESIKKQEEIENFRKHDEEKRFRKKNSKIFLKEYDPRDKFQLDPMEKIRLYPIESLSDIVMDSPLHKTVFYDDGSFSNVSSPVYFHNKRLMKWLYPFHLEEETIEGFLFKNNSKILTSIQDLIFNLNKLGYGNYDSNEKTKLIDDSLALIDNILDQIKSGKHILSKQKQTD